MERQPTGVSPAGSVSEAELAPDDLAHDLVGPAADRAQTSVAQRSLDLVLPHVAVAAEQLDDVVRGPHAIALRHELGHCRLAKRVVPRYEQVERVVGER